MKAAVLYRSKTGFTKKYAEWIAEDLSVDAHDLDDVRNLSELLQGIDTLVFGGGLYAIGINGLKKLLADESMRDIRNVFIFCTGLSIDSDEVQREIYENNIKDIDKLNIKLYYYRGGFDFKKLNRLDQLLMRILKLKIVLKKKRKALASDEVGMLAVFNRQVDFTDQKLIRKLVQDVQSC
ncbi:MAG TPA: flavodoxin domain-containing protein [Proteiniclasticum sp.]|nr:flavodoxin domain-containing protein [Proteiniclasticum sp.]